MASESDYGDRLHWENSDIEWDGGEQYTLVVPHYLDAWPAAWLHGNADAGLQAVPGCEDVIVAVSQATPLREPGTAGWSAPGYVTVSRIRQPFPDHARLRSALSALVDDAYRATRLVQDELDPFLRGLRSGR